MCIAFLKRSRQYYRKVSGRETIKRTSWSKIIAVERLLFLHNTFKHLLMILFTKTWRLIVRKQGTQEKLPGRKNWALHTLKWKGIFLKKIIFCDYANIMCISYHLFLNLRERQFLVWWVHQQLGKTSGQHIIPMELLHMKSLQSYNICVVISSTFVPCKRWLARIRCYYHWLKKKKITKSE